MKYSYLSTFTQAGEICKDYQPSEENAFNWTESSFNEKRAEESLSTLQYALNNDSSVNACGLHNALQIVEGYMLKRQALTVLSSKDDRRQLR